MASKLLSLFLLVAAVAQGYANLTEVTLADEHVTFISHPLIGKTFTIPKWWFDTLLTCHVVMPNGIMYEAYPNNNIPFAEVYYLEAAKPFNACGIGLRNIGVGWSGPYELKSLVQHQDNSMTLTSQRFHLTVIESEVGMPTK